jgi:hypothetical protein
MIQKNILALTISFIMLLLMITYNYSNSDGDVTGLANTNESSRSKNKDEYYAYETDANSADECSSYEYFDPESSTCYFECRSEEECSRIEKSVNDEIDSWTEEKYNDDKLNESQDIKDSDQMLAEYNIIKGEKAIIAKGQNTSTNEKLWRHISDISPDYLSDKYVETFQIFDDPNSDTLAFVDDEDMNGKWRIALNLTGYNKSTTRERNLTIVHELGHILSLNMSELSNIEEEKCLNYYTNEGCANTDSYLNLFVKKFWNKSDLAQNKKENSEFGSSLFNKSNFVTEYSATNPVEDVAESFAYFVINKDISGYDIKDKKIAFFYDYQALSKVRDDMRNAIVSDIIRARKLATE